MMNCRQLLPIGSALAAASIFLAACSSSAATPAPTLGGLPGSSPAPSLALPSGIVVPSIAIPSVAIPSIAIPSIAIPSIAIPSIAIPSIAIPSFSIPPIPSFALPSGVVVPSIAIPSIAIPSIPTGSFAIPSFSFPSEDKDLEARLPNQINGVTLVKYSFKGSTFLESGSSNSQDLVDLLTALGKTPDDMSVAFAADANGELDVQIGAFKVSGADSNALLNGFVVATKNESPQDVVTQVSAGGKNVTQIVDPEDTESGTVYIYASGDTLFYVASPDPALAATALQALP